MYHWFFLFEITMVKIMNNLNVCSAHSYLYHRSRFKDVQCRHVLLYVNCYCNNINEGKWKWAFTGHVGHVTYSFINMLFISMIIFVYHSINKAISLVIWRYALPTNFVGRHYHKCRFKTNRVVLINMWSY
jgi:hypothetical protein